VCVTNKILVGLLTLAFGCVGSGGDSNDADEPPVDPPRPTVATYYDEEPNDTLAQAQFLTILPIPQGESIWGTLEAYNDTDAYYFFLHPGVSPDKGEDWVADIEKLLFNFVLEGDVISPRVSLYQTVFDDIGLPTGEYKQVGIYIGYDGFLLEYDISVPYDAFYNLDLFFIVQGIGVDVGGYTVDFWITGTKEG
jgi:hypothetical protein